MSRENFMLLILLQASKDVRVQERKLYRDNLGVMLLQEKYKTPVKFSGNAANVREHDQLSE